MSPRIPLSVFLKRKWLYFRRSIVGDLFPARPIRRTRRAKYFRGIQ